MDQAALSLLVSNYTLGFREVSLPIMSDSGRIDTHQHFVPPKYDEVIKREGANEFMHPSWTVAGSQAINKQNGTSFCFLSLTSPGPEVATSLDEAREIARDSNLHELELLQCMRSQQPLHAGYPFVTKLIDHFHHPPSSKAHLCLVTEPLSENLLSFSGRWKKRRLPVTLVKHVTRQALLGLEYLHNICNIVHTGSSNTLISREYSDRLLSTYRSQER